MRALILLAAAGLAAGTGAAQTPTQPPAQAAAAGIDHPVRITLKEALERARLYGQQFLQANIATQLAHQDVVQAKAALLPTAVGFSQFIYTQPNDTLTGIFVSNDGPHVYNEQAQVHGDIYAPTKLADYHRFMAAEAVAAARAEVAARGLYATVALDYYTLAVAGRKVANAEQALREAQNFLSVTQKLEQGGEAAHSDVIKAEIQVEQRVRDLQDARLAADKARFAFAVLLFPDFRQDFSVEDDLETAAPLPPFPEMQQMAGRNNPDIRAAQATVQMQNFALSSARAGYYPAISFDYFYGINANQFAIHDPAGHNLLGSVAQAQLTVPVWNWGATRSKVKQAELQVQLAKNDLSYTQRQLLSELQSYYLEAQVAASQVATLRHSMELSADSLRLTILRYEAGEVTVLEVVDAQNTLILARNAFDDGLVRYRTALANLQTLTGVF